MRSRYPAFAIPNGAISYGKPHCPAKGNFMTKVNWKLGEKKTLGQNWKSYNSSEKEVEFKAYFTDKFGKENIHHELSTFKKVDKNGIMFRENFWIKIKFADFAILRFYFSSPISLISRD